MLKALKYLGIIFCCCTVVLAPLFADPGRPPVAPTHKKIIPSANLNISEGIEQIFHSFNSQDADIGIIVQSTTTGETLYQRNATRLFTPASTLKLFTAAATLSYLDPNSVFATQFRTDAAPIGSVIPSNLYVKFSGDPMLQINDLQTMIHILNQNGIHTIHGDLVIDDTATDHVMQGPGWLWDDQVLCYSAPASAIILNRNCFSLSLSPGKKTNAPASIKLNNNLTNISVINEVVTRRAKQSECPLDLKPDGNNTYTLTGCLAPHHKPLSLSVALSDPIRVGTDIIIELFRKQNINISGITRYGKTPNNSKLLIEHDSPPLRILITRMLKKSDNLIADSFFKKLGATYFHTSGTWANGTQAVKAILALKGIDVSNMVMLDGSGLSRDDKVTPLQFAALLNYTYHLLPTNTIFYQALPTSGIDGTLKYRLGGSTLGKIRAKTGTMKVANSLAGYVESVNHHIYTFVIIVNGFPVKKKQVPLTSGSYLPVFS